MLVGVAVTATASAASFHIGDGNIPWPTTAEFATSTDDADFPSADSTTGSLYTLSQTFLVDEAFDANSLFFSYRNKLTSTISAKIQIIKVADRFASSLAATPAAADIVYEATLAAPSTLFDPINNVNGERVVAQVLLGTPVALEPTTGAAGYEVRVTDLDSAGEFRWYRRSGGTDLEGELYTFGNGYRNLTPRGFQRDYAVALSSVAAVVPEPATCVMLVFAGVSTGLARRR